ncbi:MAG TPA: polymer-forming cytoskeletal protein [Myxococcota bacterium]|nr:polymer-forming cytoskeletal protein [Myxococcota bacterium]HNZ03630.1 polymer-forming cytoskeletal protein [Myxococcota bacterium]HOD07014.1 polymer-forming cytoskeletal protein [Myxococcota bacterium]HPB49619.1 polymer-forming cytoskeletal protein [Myxococcota bacterium]HQP94913.1 polymer-forming cytoskeletal protein [Myxococcota bacterium]
MSDEFGAVIGRNIVVRGEIEGSEVLLVEGRVEGTVNLESELVVGVSGHVEADVNAQALTIEGEFSGTAACSDIVTLVNGCHGTGELKAPRVVIEEGAVFTGRLNMETGVRESRGE